MKIDMTDWQWFQLGGDEGLCDVVYGVNLELVNCVETDKNDPEAVAFVSRTESNNGVSAYVKPVPGVIPQPKDTITVAGGGSVLATFLQTQPFYSGRDLYLLYPKEDISRKAKLFLVTVIKANKYRYNYGRQANVTLPHLRLRLPATPDGKPDWQWMESYVDSLHSKPLKTSNGVSTAAGSLGICAWRAFSVGDIFDIVNGKGITTEEIENNPGDLEAVQSGEGNNGVMGHIDKTYCQSMGYSYCEEPCLTVARSGTSGFVSFHGNGCVVGDSAKILLLKEPSAKTAPVYLFLQTLLKANRFKYTYGRKVTESLYRETVVKLPATPDGKPDWRWMEDYIRSLPYGDRL